MWLAKLKRMLDELPEQYLQPVPVDSEAVILIPPGSKPVSRLTEEEKRLYGAYNQLCDAVCREAEAHRALYGQDDSKHPPEACHKFAEQMRPRDEEAQLVLAILARSLKERLGFENEYIIDNHDVYAVPYITIALMGGDTGNDQSMPDDMNIPGLSGWPETKH